MSIRRIQDKAIPTRLRSRAPTSPTPSSKLDSLLSPNPYDLSIEASKMNAEHAALIRLPQEIRDLIYSFLFDGVLGLRAVWRCHQECLLNGFKPHYAILRRSVLPISEILLCENCTRRMYSPLECRSSRFDSDVRSWHGVLNHTCLTLDAVPVQLLRVCRQLYDEVRPILRSKTVVYCYTAPCIQPFLPAQFHFITKICVQVSFTETTVSLTDASGAKPIHKGLDPFYVKHRFPSLEEMTMAVRSALYDDGDWVGTPFIENAWIEALIEYQRLATFKVNVVAKIKNIDGCSDLEKRWERKENERTSRLVRNFKNKLAVVECAK